MLAGKVIVMTKNSARLLIEDYQLDPEKVIVIPHGTHNNSPVGADELKLKYQLENKSVLTSFGLLSPNKGIEKGILAMKEISAGFPHAMYIVLGHTHPNLLKQEGEKYRDYLQQLIADNHLEKNVRLVNEYASTQKLMEYLTLTDIYLFENELAENAIRLLQNDSLRKQMAKNAFLKTRDTTWKKVAEKHTRLFYEIFEKPVFTIQPNQSIKRFSWKQII